jgi:hypothetical protein
MARKSVSGVCRICGDEGPLSYEHVPPEAAFNNERVLEANPKRLLEGEDYLTNPRGKFNQRGAGAYTLCVRCNSYMGSCYAPAYIDFAKQCMKPARSLPTGAFADITLQFYPLRVLKQFVAMHCSANPPEGPRFARFLLNKHDKNIMRPRMLLSLRDEKRSRITRQAGAVGVLNAETGENGLFSEISFPPFNSILILDGYGEAKNLTDVSWFVNYSFNEITEASIRFFNLPAVTPFPGDYTDIAS